MNLVTHTAGAYPGFCSIKRLGVLLRTPPEWMVIHRRLPPPPPRSISCGFPDCLLVRIYTPLLVGERHCESKVSCPRTQHNDPARAQTRTSRSGVQRANHQANGSSF